MSSSSYQNVVENGRRGRAGGLFSSLVAEANREVGEEHSTRMASILRQKEEEAQRDVERRRMEETRRGLERARRIDQEQKDELMAFQLHGAERKMQEAWMKKQKSISERDAETARCLAEQEREAELERLREHRLLSQKDRTMAEQLQDSEMTKFSKHYASVGKAWSKPDILINCDGKTTKLTIHLPQVDTMEVDLDEEEAIILIRACPKSLIVNAQVRDVFRARVRDMRRAKQEKELKMKQSGILKKLSHRLQTFRSTGKTVDLNLKNNGINENGAIDVPQLEFDINLQDLVGEGQTIDLDSITSDYDAKKGNLTIGLGNIVLSHDREEEASRNLRQKLLRLFGWKKTDAEDDGGKRNWKIFGEKK